MRISRPTTSPLSPTPMIPQSRTSFRVKDEAGFAIMQVVHLMCSSFCEPRLRRGTGTQVVAMLWNRKCSPHVRRNQAHDCVVGCFTCWVVIELQPHIDYGQLCMSSIFLKLLPDVSQSCEFRTS